MFFLDVDLFSPCLYMESPVYECAVYSVLSEVEEAISDNTEPGNIGRKYFVIIFNEPTPGP